jgi:hypothetical protein
MTLVGIGASLGAFSWLVNTEWFKNLFKIVSETPTVEMIKTTVETKTDIIGNIKPGQGLTQLMNAMNNAGITPNTTPEQFLEQVKILGGGDVNAGINALAAKGGIFVNPEAAKSVLNDIAQNPHSHGNTLGQIFKGKWAGTGKSVGDMLTCKDMGQVKGLIAGTLVKSIPTIVMKSSVKLGAGYAAAKGLGSILGPIGVAAVAAGALVKIMRMKGQKQSRAKTLYDLYQSLQNIEGGTGIIALETEPISIEQASDIKQLSQSNSELPNGNEPKGLGQGQPQLPNNDEPKGLGQGQPQLPNSNEPKSLGQLPDTEEPSEKSSDINSAFKSITDLFKFINSANKDTSDKFKKDTTKLGNKAIYKKTGDVVDVKQISPNSYKVKLGNGKEIKASVNDLKPIKNTISGNSKFIKNENLLDYLNKEIGPKKISEFEGFLENIVKVRDVIKTVQPSGSKLIDNLINNMKNNPIMYTNFEELFNINERENFGKVKNEIVDLSNNVFANTSKLKVAIIDLLKNNQNSLNESVVNPEEEAQNRKNFKKNLLKFLNNSITLFKYIIKNKGKSTKKKVVKPNDNPEQGKLFENVDVQKNKVINEQIERIKKIMYKSY